MGYVTKYGSFWGMVPQTSGRIFWVAPSASYTVEGRAYSASDNNDGLSPELAFLTLDYAVGKCTANVGDVIVLLPGAHSWSASVAVDVAGITITGIPRGAVHQGTRMPISGTQCVSSVTTSATDEIMNVTVADVEICHLHFIPAAATPAVDFTSGANRLHIHDCTWNMTTSEDTATVGIACLSAASLVSIDHNFAYVVGNQGPWIRSVGGPANSVVENNTVILEGATAWDDVIEVTTGAVGLTIRDNDFYSSTETAIMTDVVDITGNTSDGEVHLTGNRFPVGSDALQASATPDATFNLNYLGTSSGGTGGGLVTA